MISKFLKRLSKYGLPLIIAGFGLFAIQYFDKLMLKILILPSSFAFSAIGLYAFSEKIASLFNLISTSFRLSWIPYVLKTFRIKGIEKKYSLFFNNYVFALSTLLILLCILSFTLIPILMPQYNGAIKLIPLVASSILIYSIGDYAPIGLDILKKSRYRAITAFLSVALNIILNICLIPYIGIMGVIIASYISVSIFAIIQLYFQTNCMWFHMISNFFLLWLLL